MNYQTLHTAIDAYIKRNGRQEITGNILNGVLSLMTDTLGEGYQFGGVISPDTIFMPTDAKEFFICSEPGTYISFGGIVAEEGELTLITYSDGFEKSVITGVGGAEGAVKYDEPQTLSQAQQTQARNNIDAASKAQVTRIALNVGFTDKIKDTATTLEDLSNKVSIINVIDGDRIAGCILPSSQTGQIGWLYEFEEGWMLTKDVSSYEVGEHTWEDLLWYLDANSGKIVNAIRLALITGDLSALTTEDKSTLVAAINEVNADKASSAALTAEVTRATAAEGALSGEIGDLSSLTTTDKSNLVNAINEVAQGGGGGSEWELVNEFVTDASSPKRLLLAENVGQYSQVIVERVAATVVNTNAYLEIGAGVTLTNIWLSNLNAAYRNVWRVFPSNVITFCEGYYYNFANDRMRLTAKEFGTGFGADMSKGLYLYFYQLASAPSGETYRVYAIKR